MTAKRFCIVLLAGQITEIDYCVTGAGCSESPIILNYVIQWFSLALDAIVYRSPIQPLNYTNHRTNGKLADKFHL